MHSSNKKKILALSGSIRKDSSNEKLLHYLKEQYKDSVEIQLYPTLEVLPHFNPDNASANIPEVVQDFITNIEHADAVLICTPEYIFSLPGVLKNALEWTVATTVFSDKPCAFIVASSLGDKGFEELDLIMKTLLQKAVGPELKMLIQGVRSKTLSSGLDPEIAKELSVLMNSLLQLMNDQLK